MWSKLVFGGLGRRGLEAIVAGVVLSIVIAIVATSLMIVEGAQEALRRAEQNDRPDIVQVKGRFNRALFETPRSGNLPPAMLPVYEPLIDPAELAAAVGASTIIPRQSFLRNVVSGDTFLNIYVFGIAQDRERQVSSFSITRGRFLRDDDGAMTVIDQASAGALGVDVGGKLPVRKADGEDLDLTVVGILDRLDLRGAPPRTAETPMLAKDLPTVSTGAFVNLKTSEEIFGRETLTDALVTAPLAADVPGLVGAIREAFRLEPGIFVTERYEQFRRKVHDFALTLVLFTLVGATTALLAGSFAANLLHDVYAERRNQYAILIALGFSPRWALAPGIAFGLAMAVSGTIVGGLLAITMAPRRFAMPSLMAELGTIEPRLSWEVVGAVLFVAISAVVLGMVPIGLRLLRLPIASMLSSNR